MKDEQDWVLVKKGSKITKPTDTYYIKLSNAYSKLAEFSADPGTPDEPTPATSLFKLKAAKRRQRKLQRAIKKKLTKEAKCDDDIIEDYIVLAEDERTAIAKADMKDRRRVTIDAAHAPRTRAHTSVLQHSKNIGRALSATVRRAVRQYTKKYSKNNRVTFEGNNTTATFNELAAAVHITYDSGADGHYVSERDRQQLGLPILRVSTKRVGVADGGVSRGKYVTKLPFSNLSAIAAQADTFDTFPTSLMSVGKTADDGNISIFGKSDVKVYKEEDVLITCKGAAILIGKRDERGRYRIPLTQNHGHWQPRMPTKGARKFLQQANSVYDLPSTEEAIKWMHAVCGYPVKSTWIKAVKAGNYVGWPLLNERTVRKYYPETVETPKGHKNQTRKNVRTTRDQPTSWAHQQEQLAVGQSSDLKISTRGTRAIAAQIPFSEPNTSQLRGKKLRDVYTKVYDVRETVFSDQTGAFPTRSQQGNKYIMVMVEIDSNAILVEPLKSRNDQELARAYKTLMTRLQQAGIVPKKHVLDNEVSKAMKSIIKEEYRMEMELVPPGCHRRNAAEVAIRNFKSHFLSVLAGTAEDFPPSLWDRLLPQTEITLNLLRQSNATPNVSAYAHLSGPFDYNKQPLAPMGCAVQVHEKTDKRGTWSYHTVDGWYLATSPEHYRTHRCHIKATRSERFTDTVEFRHKRITNPTITHADKVMKAIADCARTITDTNSEQGREEMRQLAELTQYAMHKHPQVNVSPTTIGSPTKLPRVQPRKVTVSAQSLPRVPTFDELQRQTRSMTQAVQQSVETVKQLFPKVETPDTTVSPPPPPHQPMSAKRRKRKQRKAAATTAANNMSEPAYNTRARKATATTEAAPLATRTRSRRAASTRVSRIQAPTISTRNKKRQEKALTALKLKSSGRHYTRRLTKQIERLESEVHQAMAVMDAETGQLLNYKQLIRSPKYKKDWSYSAANEFGRLANGVGGRIANPTNTIKFIRKQDIPKGRFKDVTYGTFVCSVRPEKKEKNRTRYVVGGNRTNYDGPVATPTADMMVAKLLFNSVVSTKGAKFMTIDISNFYLMTPLPRPEYIRISINDMPEEIIKEYGLKSKADNKGMVFIEANKGMYGLPQSGLLANELLEKRLNKRDYFQSKLVPGLWSHKWRPVQFTLVVDDFGVKYVGEEHALHLKKTLQEDYTVTTEWDGRRYIGITLDWDYKRRQVHLSMPGYAKKALKQFKHTARKKQNQPFPSAIIQYGAKKQYAKGESKSPRLDKAGKKFIQQVCGKFLFLGRAVDSTLLCPISAIASQASKPTEDTMEQTLQLLDYIASQDEAVLTYNASDMKLAVHSDASYLSEPQARSRAGGHFFLSNEATIPANNGAVLNIAHIIKHVMSSATEAELAALYITAREAVYIRIVLEEMGHKQPPTPIQTDNAMADAVCNGKIQPKRTKAMDMRFHWLRDRERQRQFRIYWRPGKSNYADYWTKHHPATHHKHTRREFITPHIVLEMLRIEQNMKAATAA